MGRHALRNSLLNTLAIALVSLPLAVLAQTYPAKTVRILVGITPGSPSDSVARLLAQHLSSTWGQPVVVENRPGVGGNIAVDMLAKAEPDGHTLAITPSGPIVVNVSLMKLSYDPVKDLTPVTMVYSTPVILTVAASLPVNSVGELVAYVKGRPGKLNYGSAGIGSFLHLAGEMFKQRASLDAVHVPYKGGPESMAALLSGDVAFNFTGLFVMPQVQAGKLKALAMTSLQRTRLAPEVPTMVEAGFPGFEANAWGGLFLPARTPAQITKKVHADVLQALADAGVRSGMMKVGVEPVGNTAEEFDSQIKAEIPRWAQLIRSAGIKAQ